MLGTRPLRGKTMMRRILVVDDSSMMRALYKHLLARVPNCDVFYASNGEEALAAVLERKPHLVFLDINMPRMDGLELLAELRRNDLLVDMRVVLVTTEGR